MPSARDDKDETQFHFQNDLLVRFSFQMFTSRIGGLPEVSTVNLSVLPYRLSQNFHFSAPFPAMAKPRAFRASDFNPRVKERVAAEMRVTHNLGSSWPEIATRYDMSEGITRLWSAGDMTTVAHHDRRGTTGHPRKLTAAEEGVILQ
jgi:hypothetical protein